MWRPAHSHEVLGSQRLLREPNAMREGGRRYSGGPVAKVIVTVLPRLTTLAGVRRLPRDLGTDLHRRTPAGRTRLDETDRVQLVISGRGGVLNDGGRIEPANRSLRVRRGMGAAAASHLVERAHVSVDGYRSPNLVSVCMNSIAHTPTPSSITNRDQ
jgi:hypothetical protein